MPVGSSIKPLSIYGPAFDLGNSPGTPVLNLPIPILNWVSENRYPNNFGGGGFTGSESMRYAMNRSQDVYKRQLFEDSLRQISVSGRKGESANTTGPQQKRGKSTGSNCKHFLDSKRRGQKAGIGCAACQKGLGMLVDGRASSSAGATAQISI